MNISCPNCSAVFPRPNDGGQAECPLCLHTFEPSGQTTAAAAALDLPSADDDEFESFGAPVSGSTVTLGSNAESAEASSGDDLFASASDDVDFSALLGDVGQGDDDPFASPSLEDDDLFAAPDPFSSEPSTSLDPSFDDVDDDALFVSSPNSSGAAFDDDDEDDFEQGVGAAQLARDEMDAEIADRRRQGDDKRPKRAMGAAVNRLLIFVLLLLVAGIGLDFAGIDVVDKAYELAGMARPKSRKRAAKQMRPIPQNLKDPTQILDTAKTYQLEVERLKKVLAVRPDDPAIQDKLANANLDLLERYPLAFLADNAYGRELKELLAKRPQRRFPLVNRLAASCSISKRTSTSWRRSPITALTSSACSRGPAGTSTSLRLRRAGPPIQRRQRRSVARRGAKSKKLNSAYETAKRALDKAQGANNASSC